jgi:magnesium transporter
LRDRLAGSGAAAARLTIFNWLGAGNAPKIAAIFRGVPLGALGAQPNLFAHPAAMTDPRNPDIEKLKAAELQGLRDEHSRPEPREADEREVEPREADHAQEALEEVQSLLARFHLIDTTAREIDAEAGISNQGPNPAVQPILDELSNKIEELHPADIAYILEALPLTERIIVWDLIKTAERDGDILVEVSDAVRETLIENMDRADLVAAAETLDTDELADIAEDLPREVIDEVREGLTHEEREQLRAAMSYPDDAVGALMDFEMVEVREDVTLEVVLRYMRRMDELPDHTDQIFVVDRASVLQGALPINRLLVSDADALVEDIMTSDMLTLNPWDKADDAAQAFERYDLVSAPVIDADNKLVGRVTVNEVMDYIREAQEEENLSKAGLREEEDIFAPISRSVKNRAPWLMLNLCTASTAAYVASRFEGTVSHIVILAFLMSIVAGIGGNSGNQTMTLIIRGLALGQITSANVRRLVTKELSTTFLIGLGGGLIAGTFATFISGRLTLGLVMMGAMMLNLLVGATVGMLVPLARYRMGRDPAVGSSVLLTFATDTMGFFIFLGLATLFLL